MTTREQDTLKECFYPLSQYLSNYLMWWTGRTFFQCATDWFNICAILLFAYDPEYIV